MVCPAYLLSLGYPAAKIPEIIAQQAAECVELDIEELEAAADFYDQYIAGTIEEVSPS